MADISKITTPDGTTYDIKDSTARSQSGVSGVKGSSETTYRTGNVDLSASDLGLFNQTAASGGTTTSLVTTGEKYTWNNKSNLAIGTTSTTAAAGNHAHGNITNGGDITTTATIASGDRLVINDESASKINNSSITFGTSTSTYLRNDGTWGTPSGGGDLGFVIKYGTSTKFSANSSNTGTCTGDYSGFSSTPLVIGTLRGVSSTTNQLVLMVTNRTTTKVTFTIRNNGTATRTGHVDFIAIGT